MQNYEQRLGIDMVSDTHTKFEQHSVKTGMISEQNYTEEEEIKRPNSDESREKTATFLTA